MKKKLITAGLLVSIASFSAFGQGYITFSAGANTVKDATTGANSVGYVAFLFAPVGTTSDLGAGSPTSAAAASASWSDVTAMLSSGWTLGEASSVEAVGVISGAAFGGGSFAYNNGASFAVDGWTAGSAQSVVVVGWYGSYTTIEDAAANNANLGWSSAFTYQSGAGATDPIGTVNFSGQATPIGAFGIAPVPEPTTIALAGLGAISLLGLRRKK